MPTEELEQALLAAKWGDAEEDHVEIVARLLELPRAAVVRVMFAVEALRDIRGMTPVRALPKDEIPEEVQAAMKVALRRGMARALVRWAIESGEHMFIHPRALTKDKGAICSGCPVSIECVTENLSTPATCLKMGPIIEIRRFPVGSPHLDRNKRGVRIHVTRIHGDVVTVVAAQPRGEYTVDVEELWWT